MDTTRGALRRPTPAIWHVRAQQRAAAVHARRAAHLGAFLGAAVVVPPTPYRFADLPHDSYGRGEGMPSLDPWRPAPWALDKAA